MKVEKDVYEDKSEPFFPFGSTPGSVIIFSTTPKEKIGELLDNMMVENTVPSVKVNPNSVFCQRMLDEQDEQFRQHFRELIIPVRYTKVFRA